MFIIFGLPATDGAENGNEDLVRQVKDMGPCGRCHAVPLHHVNDKLDRVGKHDLWRNLSSQAREVGVCGSVDDRAVIYRGEPSARHGVQTIQSRSTSIRLANQYEIDPDKPFTATCVFSGLLFWTRRK